MEMISDVTFQTFRPFLPFGAIFGHFWPLMAQNSKLSLTGHVTTQNDRKRSRNTMKMVSDVTFQTFRPFLVIWGLFRPFLANFGPKLKIVVNRSCDHSKWPQEEQKSNGDGFGCHFSDFQANFGHLRTFLAIFDHFWPETQACCKLVMWPLNTIARPAEIWWRWFHMARFCL